MPLVRKRRAQPEPEPSSDDGASSGSEVETHIQAENARRRRRRTEEATPSEQADSSDGDDTPETRAPSSTDVMVKKLVRLAMASEYSRGVIRRADISAKVLGEQGSRQFKTVFEAAQKALRVRFGMEMVELPVKEKVTLTQRRAAQKVEKPSTANKSWVVTSTLPKAYRTPEILPPTKAPSSSLESSYTALYTFIISVIMLNGGSLAEARLNRYLKRANAEVYTPVDRTDRLIQRLCREGYLARHREIENGDENIEYTVGPRGKVEVGEKGVVGLARQVYGRPDPEADGDDVTAAEREQMRDFEGRLRRSLGIRQEERNAEGGATQNERNNADERRSERTRQSRRRAPEEESENDDDEDSDD